MNSNQTRFVRGAYSAHIPGMSGVFSVSTGFPVYKVLRMLFPACQPLSAAWGFVATYYLYVFRNKISSSSRPTAPKICFLSRSDDAVSTMLSRSSVKLAGHSSARESE